MPKKERSPISITVRTGCTTRPSENAISVASMASINLLMLSTARTSDSDSQRGVAGHFTAPRKLVGAGFVGQVGNLRGGWLPPPSRLVDGRGGTQRALLECPRALPLRTDRKS